jgi:AraC-like DNA-binding protein
MVRCAGRGGFHRQTILCRFELFDYRVYALCGDGCLEEAEPMIRGAMADDPESRRVLANLWRRIADVSQEVGFAAQSHFATIFRTLVGMTPRAYQRQRGGK